MRKILLCLLVLAAPAQAQVSGSNIGLTDYPGPTCSKPPIPQGLPDRPKSDTDKAAVESYNAKVKAYNDTIAVHNSAMTAFNDCMRTYVQNGNADMNRIKQKLDQAIAAASAR